MSLSIRDMEPADLFACARMACASEIGERYGFEAGGLAARLAVALEAWKAQGTWAAREARAAQEARDRGVARQAEACPLFVAESEGALVGFAWIDPRGAFSSAPYLRLVAVAPGSRSSGVGAALLAQFESRTEAVGRDWCLLVSDFNERAQVFYERHGYRRIGVLPEFAHRGIDEVLMVKRRNG